MALIGLWGDVFVDPGAAVDVDDDGRPWHRERLPGFGERQGDTDALGLTLALGLIDGDTLVVEGERVRLLEIDAPARKQICWYRVLQK